MTRTLATQAALRRRRRAWRSTKTAAAAVAASTVGFQARMRPSCFVSASVPPPSRRGAALGEFVREEEVGPGPH